MANRVAQEGFNHLIGDLKATHGDNLVSVILYGADPSASRTAEHRVLVVLERIGPSDLRADQEILKEWTAGGNPEPAYFTNDR